MWTTSHFPSPSLVVLLTHTMGKGAVKESPLFLGFVAAASGKDMLNEQLKNQKTTFKLQHLEHAMVNKAELKAGKGLKEVFVTSPTEMVGVPNGTAMPDEKRE